MPGYDISMRTFKALLGQSDPGTVLAFLNGLTEHRFTALFAIDGEELRTVCMFDREAPDTEFSGSVPVTSSYCLFVRDGQSPFAVEDSMIDNRVLDHPKRLEVKSYFGVAVEDNHKRLLGTLCHFDQHPLELHDDAGAFLQDAAPLVAYVIQGSRP